MRVLITRPEREATTLAAALGQRGHDAVIAPLFQLQILSPPPDFTDALAACQGVLLTSANGARALAVASEQRSKPVVAVGDTTASTAEGLGFSNVASAAGDGAALAEMVRSRLTAGNGPLIHVSGVDVAGDLGALLAPSGFDVRRFALYEARAADRLPDTARAALQAHRVDAAAFFSPRAAELFARLTDEAGLAEACREVAAVAISAATAKPLVALPFKAVHVADRPTRQAVLDMIDRAAAAVVQETQPQQHAMSDTPTTPPATPPQPPAATNRGLGILGAFLAGVVASLVVLVGAVVSLPYWPEPARALWRGPPQTTGIGSAELARQQADAKARQDARSKADAEINTRLDELDKKVRAAATTAAQADRPPTSDPAIADLRGKIEALEKRPVANPDTDKDIAALKDEIAGLRNVSGAEQKAVAAARASAVIGIAARLSAALDSGLPFAADLALLAPLAKDDTKLAEISASLQPLAGAGVASREALAADFPAVARAVLADDLADDSFGERLLGKLKALVSLRRVGADVPGDSVEAKLARAEAALDAGDIAKAVETVKTLPPATTARAAASWLARAETHLSAQSAVDQLASHAVSLLGNAAQ
jgi:uroporphyrinogen-III synthase